MRALLLSTLLIAGAGGVGAGDWSPEANALSVDGTALVTCRSRLAGEYLLVELRVADGWHVYAMDNERRAKDALAGRMSLGVERNTEVFVDNGLQVVGDWYQSEPKDFSQPELRWYSYGFEGTSLFAAKVSRGEGDVANLQVRAQACDSSSCVSVEAEMELSLGGGDDVHFEPVGLIRVQGS